MHQPNYQEPGSNRMVLPWVRLHATKDYLDMLLTVGEYENVRVTFNLVPSLLDQLQMYVDGGSDPNLDLSRLRAEDMTPSGSFPPASRGYDSESESRNPGEFLRG
jgi:alpha-amylase/alpha-mannosidase (GH57 family)